MCFFAVTFPATIKSLEANLEYEKFEYRNSELRKLNLKIINYGYSSVVMRSLNTRSQVLMLKFELEFTIVRNYDYYGVSWIWTRLTWLNLVMMVGLRLSRTTQAASKTNARFKSG